MNRSIPLFTLFQRFSLSACSGKLSETALRLVGEDWRFSTMHLNA
jgi:hypothetical protein